MSSVYCEKTQTCKNAWWCAADYNPKGNCLSYAAMTNFDRITSSVEALAKFIVEIADCHECEEMHGFRMCDAAPEKTCDDCWAGWLRKEA